MFFIISFNLDKIQTEILQVTKKCLPNISRSSYISHVYIKCDKNLNMLRSKCASQNVRMIHMFVRYVCLILNVGRSKV
jgi:hypothetical protein